VLSRLSFGFSADFSGAKAVTGVTFCVTFCVDFIARVSVVTFLDLMTASVSSRIT
jgi:hypothetical protein